MTEFMGHYGKKRNGFDWGRGQGRRGGPTNQKWSSAHRPLGLIFIFSTPPPPSISPAAGLRSGLPADRAHRGEQVQHVRVGRVAPQEQAHVHRDDGQRQDHQRQEGPAEEHQLPLPAADGAAAVIGRRRWWWLRGRRQDFFSGSDRDNALTEGRGQEEKRKHEGWPADVLRSRAGQNFYF